MFPGLFGLIVVAGGYIFSGEDGTLLPEMFNVLPGGCVVIEGDFTKRMCVAGPVLYAETDF
jgi:hypothetical protein